MNESISIHIHRLSQRVGMCGVMVFLIENKFDEPSSNPGQGSLHFTSC